MDATPVTLGQEFGGYAAQVRYGIERLEATLPRLGELPLGGTAVGTGINAPAGFAARGDRGAAPTRTGLPLTEARDHFEAQGARDGLVELSRAAADDRRRPDKVANDIRWMGSGPRAGLAEIRLPDLQPGSSIMPGKVNPVIPEALLMVCAQVIGNDAADRLRRRGGQLRAQRHAAGDRPQPARVDPAARATHRVLFADRCVGGIAADVEHAPASTPRGRRHRRPPLNRSSATRRRRSIAKQALAERKTIRAGRRRARPRPARASSPRRSSTRRSTCWG